ncbi:MAG: radical SAM protein [Thermaerobacter sp.]|nr:radical SAM protein [Thermaerobacter sp.]
MTFDDARHNRGGCPATPVSCRRILSRCGIPGYEYSLNPYRGCLHACAYCYASFLERFRAQPRPWGSFLEAKENAPEALARELPRARPGRIFLSSVTDPYQPAEGACRITRGLLEVLADAPAGFSLTVLTKGELVLGDAALLRQLGARVGLTLTCPRDADARRVEPGAVPTSRRLAVLGELGAVGVATWAFLGPLLPGLYDAGGGLAWLLEELARAGVRQVTADCLNPYPRSVARLRVALSGRARAALEEALREPAAYRERLRRELAAAAAGRDLSLSCAF